MKWKIAMKWGKKSLRRFPKARFNTSKYLPLPSQREGERAEGASLSPSKGGENEVGEPPPTPPKEGRVRLGQYY